MEHIRITCDIADRQHSELISRKKVPVMFDHDQEDGKSKMSPFFEMVDIDICEECFKEMTEKRILIYAYGAMGHNRYSFPDLMFLSTSDKKDPNTITKEYIDKIIHNLKGKIIEKSTFEAGIETNGWYQIYKDDLDSIL